MNVPFALSSKKFPHTQHKLHIVLAEIKGPTNAAALSPSRPKRVHGNGCVVSKVPTLDPVWKHQRSSCNVYRWLVGLSAKKFLVRDGSSARVGDCHLVHTYYSEPRS